jgi:TRAP-type C4-dicarboxylate transport system permease small subunit
MEIFSGFLVVGLLMIIAGAILIYISLHASPQDVYEYSDSTRNLGTISIAVNGGRKWILTALIISGVLITYLIAKNIYPSIFGGI